MILRRLARPLLASVFISGGIATLRNPQPQVAAASDVVDKTVGQVKDSLPDQVPTDTESVVKFDALVKVGAGTALALGKFPRLSSTLLAASLVPTTWAGHAFWEESDPQARQAQQTQFFKNAGLLGGLLIAAADTHGKPSLGWRARRTARLANAQLHDVTGSVREGTQSAIGTASTVAGRVLPG